MAKKFMTYIIALSGVNIRWHYFLHEHLRFDRNLTHI